MSKRELRKRARDLRYAPTSIPMIAKVLGVSKGSVSNWVRDIPIDLSRVCTDDKKTALMKASKRKQEIGEEKRKIHYDAGKKFYKEKATPNLKQFIMFYICEGYKRNRNMVSMCNSDPELLKFAWVVLKKFVKKEYHVRVQYHADQNLDEIKMFWAKTLNIDEENIKAIRKSNSGNLEGRAWRCEHGVCSIEIYDTYLRSKIQAWIDCLKEEWVRGVV